MEWLAWLKLRGPVGGPREDYYNAFLALHSSPATDKRRYLKDYYPPWTPPESLESEFDEPDDPYERADDD